MRHQTWGWVIWCNINIMIYYVIIHLSEILLLLWFLYFAYNRFFLNCYKLNGSSWFGVKDFYLIFKNLHTDFFASISVLEFNFGRHLNKSIIKFSLTNYISWDISCIVQIFFKYRDIFFFFVISSRPNQSHCMWYKQNYKV